MLAWQWFPISVRCYPVISGNLRNVYFKWASVKVCFLSMCYANLELVGDRIDCYDLSTEEYKWKLFLMDEANCRIQLDFCSF